MKNGKKLIRSEGGKVIGFINDGVFTKSNWHSSRHLCRRHNAIGLDRTSIVEIIGEIGMEGIIRVPDLDTGLTYEVTALVFWRNRIEDNLGMGLQCFLPLSLWQSKREGQQPLMEQVA